MFLYGFAENVRDNINPTELKALRLLAKQLHRRGVEESPSGRELIEVTCEE